MMKRVQDFVKACDMGQRQKYVAITPSGLLQPFPILMLVSSVRFPWISSPACQKVVDCLSKYRHFIPLKHPFTACSIAAVFVKEVVRLHGIPESILRDCDPP